MAGPKLPTRVRALPRNFLWWPREPLLVLQVLDRVGVNPDEFGAPTKYVERWRDATVEDLQ